ncbi:MAG TPA: glycoside hydrolase family 2 TIM barrel-domain containing protein, partial [Puia sp.]|nr:glycoside hydrolase family 2 TIM barrel-domain containing protein [Puia sp.]
MMCYPPRHILALCVMVVLTALVETAPVFAQATARQDKSASSRVRQDISLDKNWYTIAVESDSNAFRGFGAPGYKTKNWRRVDVPHNWDAYGGYRRLRHGNLHGCAWYHRNFRVDHIEKEKKYFLWFEGVGSYATVWVNGIEVGSHAGGRTSFTLDITATLLKGDNLLTVRADHPANIRDLPWVCGACSDDRGFSEGSQPMGIFRPVHLIITHSTRVQPFGVHIWNDTSVSEQQAALFLETEIKNYSSQIKDLSVKNRLIDNKGLSVAVSLSNQTLQAGETKVVRQDLPVVRHPHLWSTGSPYLYTLVTELWIQGHLIDKVSTPYGIRRINWSLASEGASTAGKDAHPFLLNGHPVFINGIAEYEHRLGQSHAFSAAAIRARVLQIKAAGFNAFRDAHQPHNLRYQEYWDREGLLWWPQLSAHIWYDSPEFRKNFKTLLTDWVKERRNSPSLVLWGLQNESKLPADFAKECSDLIRQLDPTASSQRLITTCNGGSGTDWDVPQNWTGTYGGDPATYAEDLRKQILVGEYGAWRTLDLHAAGNDEDRMTRLMESKIRLAETVKDQVAGHFFWLFSSHDNPGRVQSGEGWRELDRIGPVNYKGLLTSWEEPLDVYYMYRSNFVSPLTSPMVYIVSHTWPDRWTTPGKKNGIVVYSNCEEVELFNDVEGLSLGKRKRNGIGTHFQWDSVDIQYNVLYAVGTVKGKVVAKDCIILHHLPRAPHSSLLAKGPFPTPHGSPVADGVSITAPQPGYHYLYRVNCGGPDYKDAQGNVWMADRHLSTGPAPADGTQEGSRLAASGRRTASPTWGSRSWTDDYPGLPPFFASQRRTADPIAGTADAPLFQDFRYGLDKLT